MSEDETAITLRHSAAMFLVEVLPLLANLVETDGPDRLTDAQFGVIFSPEQPGDVKLGLDRRAIASTMARTVSTSIREQLSQP